MLLNTALKIYERIMKRRRRRRGTERAASVKGEEPRTTYAPSKKYWSKDNNAMK